MIYFKTLLCSFLSHVILSCPPLVSYNVCPYSSKIIIFFNKNQALLTPQQFYKVIRGKSAIAVARQFGGKRCIDLICLEGASNIDLIYC